MRVIRLLVRFSVQLDQPVHVVQVSVDGAGRMAVASATVVAGRAARSGLLVTTARAATAARRHSRTSVTRGQCALAHQWAGEAFPPPVPGHDKENGDRQQYDDCHQHADNDRHVRLVLVFGSRDCAGHTHKERLLTKCT